MALFVGAIGACALFGYRETQTAPDRDALRPARIKAGIVRIATHPQSRFFVVISAISYITIISYIANASLLYIDALGMTVMGFAIVFALTGFGIVLGQYLNSLAIHRWGPVTAIWIAAVVQVAVMISMVASIAFDWFNVVSFTLNTFAYFLCFQTIYANGASLTLDPHKEIAGLAASFFGFSAQFTGTVAFTVLGLHYRGDPMVWALQMLGLSSIVVAALVLRAVLARQKPVD